MRVSGEKREVIFPRDRARRVRLLGALALVCSAVLIIRLFNIQVTHVSQWRYFAHRQHTSKIKYASERATIVDRWDRPLATSVPSGLLVANPRNILNRAEAAKRLAEVLGTPEAEILKKLDTKSAYVVLQRQLPLVLVRKISDLKIQGIDLISESRRAYPYKEAASTLLGRVNQLGIGSSGLELMYDSILRSQDFERSVARDAKGKYLSGFTWPKELVWVLGHSQSKPLRLTIDAEIQAIVEDVLEKTRQEHQAKSAFAIMVDAETGETLAMGQSPGINLNEGRVKSAADLRNLVIEQSFEPGSVMKPIVAAGALNHGVVKPDELFDLENGNYRFGRETIHDTHKLEGRTHASFREIVVVSSNIGMSKIAERLGADGVYQIIHDFGFKEKTGLDLPGEARGILRPVKNWAPVDTATHAFGQGVSVTAAQLVRAISVFANGGMLVPLSVVKKNENYQGKRLMPESTAQQMQSILRGVVEETGGTGSKAAIEGVVVGGKTGTAQKAKENGRGYAKNKYICSFVGFVDTVTQGLPHKLVMIVVVDEPMAKPDPTGGSVAAPAFKSIFENTLNYLSKRSKLVGPLGTGG